MFLGFLTLLQPVAAGAQAPEDGKIHRWFTLGLGSSLGQDLSIGDGSSTQLTSSISLNFGRRFLHQVRLVNSVGIGLDFSGAQGGGSFFKQAPAVTTGREFQLANSELAEVEFQRSLSYAVGRGDFGRNHLAAVFAGLGVVSLGPAYVGSYASKTTIGLVLNAQAVVYPLRGFGLGVDVYANLNPDASVGAVYVMLVIGGNRRTPR